MTKPFLIDWNKPYPEVSTDGEMSYVLSKSLFDIVCLVCDGRDGEYFEDEAKRKGYSGKHEAVERINRRMDGIDFEAKFNEKFAIENIETDVPYYGKRFFESIEDDNLKVFLKLKWNL